MTNSSQESLEILGKILLRCWIIGFCGLGLFKVFVLIFFLLPWLSNLLVLRKAKWPRRLCHHGLERVDRRSGQHLDLLAGLFRVSAESLWEPVPTDSLQAKRD